MIDADLHQFYGVDTADGILKNRPYVWLVTRVSGLMAVEHSRLRLKLYPPKKPTAHRRK
ncbi:hypothetical protein [Glutamicibacter nicotianae]|uniref:hypothetical protein n=1 Tax=Glutamicibacter nicotianae TaxID=37929 RepID=UPI00195668BC|nr:hypothetical protein [Glutamicibacter nicotianae]MBM7767362.1 hypothetical protein [Glutamicibacter nicotianae]